MINGSIQQFDLEERTARFAERIIELCKKAPVAGGSRTYTNLLCDCEEHDIEWIEIDLFEN